MNRKSRLMVAIAAIALIIAILAVVLAQCGTQPAPATETPGATQAATAVATPTGAATEEPGTPTATPGPTPTPTEGEKAAEAVGQEYIAYRPREAECDELVDGGKSESCVWPKDVQLTTRSEWEQLLPNTDFYLIGLASRNQELMYDHGYHLELAAWHNGDYYTAETFDRLLQDNGVTEIADENRELVGQAFALMTIPDYLEKDILFTGWEVFEVESALDVYRLTAWTQIQGLELEWAVVFDGEQLRAVSGPGLVQAGTGDYIDLPLEALPYPSLEDYSFSGE